MYKAILTLLLFSSVLFGYVDNDMDGVDDSEDLCPNTPMFDLVSLNGCSKTKLQNISIHHFDIIFGKSYSNDKGNSFNTTAFQANYYYKNFSLQFSTSYLISQLANPNTQGEKDSYINLFYKLKFKKSLLIYIGAGINFPLLKVNNNSADYSYSISLKYIINNFFLLSGLGYTKIGEIDHSTMYQNTHYYSFGLGYHITKKTYVSLNYYQAKNIYHQLEDINTLSIYLHYGLDAHWFIGINYSRGLNKDTIKNNLGVRIGYYW